MKRWKTNIEITWDILPEDLEEKWPDDTQADFAKRAFTRIRPELEALIKGDPKGIAHYHVLEWPPKVVTEFD